MPGYEILWANGTSSTITGTSFVDALLREGYSMEILVYSRGMKPLGDDHECGNDAHRGHTAGRPGESRSPEQDHRGHIENRAGS